jgi:hypothetical protein
MHLDMGRIMGEDLRGHRMNLNPAANLKERGGGMIGEEIIV